METTNLLNVHSRKPVTHTLVQRECPFKLPVTRSYHTHDRSRLPGGRGGGGDGRRQERATGLESGAAKPGRTAGDAGGDAAQGLPTHRLQRCREGDTGTSTAGHGEGRKGRHSGSPARQVRSSVYNLFIFLLQHQLHLFTSCELSEVINI